MRPLSALLVLASAVGCGTTAADSEPGRFLISLSGAVEVAVEGEATFDLANCAFIYLASDAGRLQFHDDCVTSEARTGPTEGASAISRVYKGGYHATYKVEPDGPWYRSVGGEVVVEDRSRTRVRGRFSIEAKPLDPTINRTDPSEWLDEDGPSLFIDGTFEARGLPPVPLYD